MKALTAKIAGRRRYAGTIAPRSALTLRRERDNRADGYAVAIDADGVQVGYLEAGLAEVVATKLARQRPVFASPIVGHDEAITLYLPSRGDEVGRTLVEVVGSGGNRYVVDPRRELCTCTAGRFVACRHKQALASAA